MWSTTFRLLGHSVRLDTEDARIAETLGDMTASYEVDPGQACELSYRLVSRPAPLLLLNGEPIGRPEHWLDLAPQFELDLYRQVIDRSPEDLFLHGAALAADQGALVLIGPSSSGKSTLSLALTGRGLAYITDEFVAVGHGLAVRGITRPICFSTSPPAALPEGFSRAQYRFRGPDGVHSATLATPPPERLCRQPQPLLHVVVLEQRPAAPTIMERLPAGEGLCALWQETMRCDSSALSSATALVNGRAVHCLRSADPKAACDAIVALLG
jgi:hypothetical protein